MNEEMMGRDCEKVRELIDKMIDGEITIEEMNFMEAHAQKCGACKEEIRMANELADCLHGFDEAIEPPLEAKAQWRRALRKEISREKWNKVWRTAASIAAVFIVLAMSTMALRRTDMLNYAPDQEDNAGVHFAYEYEFDSLNDIRIAPQEAVSTAASYTRSNEPAPAAYSRMAPAEEIVLQADGETGENEGNGIAVISLDADSPEITDTEFDKAFTESTKAYEESYTAKVSNEENGDFLVRSAYREAETDVFFEDVKTLTALVSEYDGYIAEEIINYAGELRMGSFVISVPEELLDGFMQALENVGKTVVVRMMSEDKEAYYYDARARRDSLAQVAERLNEMISGANESELKTITQQLEDTYSQIDEMERILAGAGTLKSA
ncbi:MAG: DUF4349 domain-containing protein, partial [Clostridia bacterium]|nr:DUF4349 domain-containing protein [Clostridia bacterium]